MFSTGFAVGFDRILLAAEKEGQTYEKEGIDAYVVPVSDDVRLESAKIVTMLRDEGLRSDIDIMGRKMAKAMKYASITGAKNVIIIGAKELESCSVTVRDMVSGEQKVIKIENLIEELKSRQ